MKCIKTGLNLRIGELTYRADLSLHQGQLYATINREPYEAEDFDVWCEFAEINHDIRPNCKLGEEAAMTVAFFAKLVRINPELTQLDFHNHNMEYLLK